MSNNILQDIPQKIPRDIPKDIISHLVAFSSLLRKSGVDVGTDQIITALKGLSFINIMRVNDFYYCLRSCLLHSYQQFELFDQVFNLYWSKRQNIRNTLPGLRLTLPSGNKKIARRVIEAFAEQDKTVKERQDEIVQVSQLSWSANEQLGRTDFESMNSEQFEQVKHNILKIRAMFKPVKSRRFKPAVNGRVVDFKKTMARSAKYSTDIIDLRFRERQQKPVPIIILIDISGSMNRYATIMLHFAYSLMQARKHVYVFVFATRLTAINPYLEGKEIDECLQQMGKLVLDYGSGTRLGSCLHEFNRYWSRQVLSRSADILLVSDGLDRGDQSVLDKAMAYLQRNCRRLIWLNPLLRYDKFEPKARGIATMLPHVNDFRAVHNLESIGDLVEALTKP